MEYVIRTHASLTSVRNSWNAWACILSNEFVNTSVCTVIFLERFRVNPLTWLIETGKFDVSLLKHSSATKFFLAKLNCEASTFSCIFDHVNEWSSLYQICQMIPFNTLWQRAKSAVMLFFFPTDCCLKTPFYFKLHQSFRSLIALCVTFRSLQKVGPPSLHYCKLAPSFEIGFHGRAVDTLSPQIASGEAQLENLMNKISEVFRRSKVQFCRGSAAKPKTYKDSREERTWTEDHLLKNLRSIHLGYLRVDISWSGHAWNVCYTLVIPWL